MPPSISLINGPSLVSGSRVGSGMTDSTKSTELASVDHGSGQLEVNFEKNVTVLYDSISNSNWDVALRTLKNNPEEARTWVVRYHENQNNGIMWRFLPLHSACARQPPIAVVTALLRAFGDAANSCDDQGMYPLHYACGNHASADVIRELVDANPTAAAMGDPNGMVPLHYMAQWGPSSVEAIEVLITASPDVKDLKDAHGYTPLEYAMEGDYPEKEKMVDYLENDGPAEESEPLGGQSGGRGGDEDDISQASHSIYEEDQEVRSQADLRRQPKNFFPSHSRTASPANSMTPSRESTRTPTTPVQQQLQYWSQKERKAGSRPSTPSNQNQQNTTRPAQPSWLTNSNVPVRSIPKTRSSTPISRLPSSPWGEQRDKYDGGHERPTTAPAWNIPGTPKGNFNAPRSSSSQDLSARNNPDTSKTNYSSIRSSSPSLLPPRNDRANTVSSNGKETDMKSKQKNKDNSNSGSSNNAPSSAVVKSLVKLRAEINKLEAEAAYNEADMEERLLTQRESFQSKIDETNAAITKAEEETASVRADMTAKDEYTAYMERSTASAEREIKQMMEDSRTQERLLHDATRVYRDYKENVDAMQVEARELSKSMKIMRQEQEHILANMAIVEEDIANASRARKKKLQAMFDEEMKYSMESAEMRRVSSSKGSDGIALTVRQKLEEQKESMEKCHDILAECE